MGDLIRAIPRRNLPNADSDPHLHEEWLVTNGLGGYASGTVNGAWESGERAADAVVKLLGGPSKRS